MPRRGDLGSTGSQGQESELDPEMSAGIEEELREFLEADYAEVDADPLFRERLRRKLWAALLRQIGGSDDGGSQD